MAKCSSGANGTFLLITANIGSLFEEFGTDLQKNWIKSFHQLVSEQKPSFIGIHWQELGGKADYQCKEDVNSYFTSLYESEIFNDYCTCSYTDQQFQDMSKYTALAVSFFVHKSLDTVEQWDFNNNCFLPFERRHQLVGVTDQTSTIRKYKFPMSCYSKTAKRLPRKGFAWTKWRIQNRVYDFLNLHLTHDASNVYCAMKSPTKYSKHRRRAFQYVLERIQGTESDHQFIFGDLNVRVDTKALVEHLMSSKAKRSLFQDDEGEPTSLVFKSLENPHLELLKIENRRFEMRSYEDFTRDKVPDLIKFDYELDWLKQEHQFAELPITFVPTYPHEEDPEGLGTAFATVRCPSWCDRVVFDSKLYDDIIKSSHNARYESFGGDTFLGDHKPVFLAFKVPGVPKTQ